MKVSEINEIVICSHLREIPENLDQDELNLLNILKSAAVDYCTNYTGLTKVELDQHEDITVAVLTLISDMWNNRETTVKNSNPNRIVETILGMYSKNLLPSGQEVMC